MVRHGSLPVVSAVADVTTARRPALVTELDLVRGIGHRRPPRPPAMLYFAYGSNLHHAGMGSRCPAAVPLGRAALPAHALVFRSWADVEPHPGGTVAGGLWRVTPACLAALDDYEDVDSGLYRRVLLPVRPEGAADTVEALVYRMTATHTAPPEASYLAVIRDGCRDFGLDERPVLAAAGGAAG